MLHLLTQIPLIVWLLLGGVAAVVVYLRFGKYAATVAASLAALLLVYFAGRRNEQSNAKVEDQSHANRIEDRADAARNDAERTPADKLREPSPFQRD